MPDDYVKRSDIHKVFQPKYAPAINRTFAAMIDSVPAADVVEVVRCKDCRYYPSGTDDGKEQGFGLIWSDEAEYRCPCFCDDGWYSRKPKPDFYCYNGTRKDGGQDDG